MQNTYYSSSITAPAVHILQLQSQWRDSNTEKDELRSRLDALQEQQKVDMEAALDNLRQEFSNSSADELEKAKLESE